MDLSLESLMYCNLFLLCLVLTWTCLCNFNDLYVLLTISAWFCVYIGFGYARMLLWILISLRLPSRIAILVIILLFKFRVQSKKGYLWIYEVWCCCINKFKLFSFVSTHFLFYVKNVNAQFFNFVSGNP